MEKRNATIDFFRIIAAVLVIVIHAGLRGLFGVSVTVALYAVPFFMLVTGYFYFINPSRERLNKVIKKTLWLWFIWMIIYLPAGIKIYVRAHAEGASALRMVLDSVVGESVCYGGSWYLMAVVVGLLVVDYLRRHNLMALCHTIAAAILIILCFDTNYRPIVAHVPMVHVNLATTVITGILWIDISYIIATKKEWLLEHFGEWRWFIIAVALTVCEYVMRRCTLGELSMKYNDMWITLPVSMVLIFTVILKHPNMQPKEHAIKFRDFATLLFFISFGVIDVCRLPQSVGGCTLVIIITAFLAAFIMMLSHRKSFKWLKRLY
ncbi:acyltransferase family protein [Ligilactobacillus sp. LYQ112]